MATPTPRPLDLRTFDELAAEVGRLRQGYTRGGQWSLGQTLDHLTKTMNAADGPGRGLPWPVQWLLRRLMGRLLRTRRMPGGAPAPKSLRPSPAVDETAALDAFNAACARASAIPDETMTHPAFGRVRVADWQQLQLVHASRHLGFLTPTPTPTVS